ncbi:hypothetical protein VSU19_19820 [Verrucomicrobiales bacterium BCK34]|nr:hypothetical protein [Verrucomicrobiales bacterium BCK34]
MPTKKQTGTGPRWIGDQPRKRYNVVLDPEVKKKAQVAAKAEGISFSMWLENAAKDTLKNHP